MPGFTGHSIAGICAGVAVTVASIELTKTKPPEGVILGLTCYIGSLMPDIDANRAVITRKFFHYMGILIGVLCSAILFKRLEYYQVMTLVFGSWAVSRYLIRPVFSKITTHRGLFHSVPAGLVISGMVGNLILFLNEYRKELSLSRMNKDFILLSCASFLVGYVVHLLLDESYSIVRMKRSLGTALKFFEKKRFSGYLLMYILAAILYLSIW
ncbi:hypothetical protein FUAX_37170 [Fulvitalea axinellae]|uniref:Metal-dependent hydrolase n=1 Tax=Fulvitalea axinellae TaxID=1182444 RepID=A0AAU9CPI3_9BACT|nr:hypothetical protein FUAX_37170 [Fulvitalea axinellae]